MSLKRELSYGLCAGAAMGFAAHAYGWLLYGAASAAVEIQYLAVMLFAAMLYGLLFSLLFHVLCASDCNMYKSLGIVTALFLAFVLSFSWLQGWTPLYSIIWILLFSSVYLVLLRVRR